MIINIAGNRQRGATTLLVAIVLLFSITLVTLFTARVVLTDTKVEANNYRARQAVASANAAMDRAVAYFDEDGLDHQDGGPCTATVGRDENVDDTSCLGFTYNNADGICTTAADMKSALVTATGTSDDGIASRTIYQCLGTIDVFGGNGPKQPLISRGSVGLTGNYNIINRYTNTTGWSGGVIDIGSSASASTYTRPVGTSSSDFSRAQKEDNDVTNAYTSEPVSDRNKGNGVDTIANDPRLSTLTGDELFNSFFFKDKEVAVVGGGNAAVEEAMFLTKFASKVKLIHRRDELRAEKMLQKKLMENKKIEIIWDSVVEEVIGDNEPKNVKGLKVKNLNFINLLKVIDISTKDYLNNLEAGCVCST